MRAALFCVPVLLAACANEIKVTDAGNTPPVVQIQNPSDQAAFDETELIEFVGTVNDGDGIDDVTSVFWVSSVDGEIADFSLAQPDASGVTRATTLLSPGSHVITLAAADEAGEEAQASITVFVGEVATGSGAPTVTIVDPTNGTNVDVDDPLTMVGQVQDPNDALDTILAKWTVEDLTNPGVLVHDGPEVAADTTGITTDSWTPTELGSYLVKVEVHDPEGNYVDDDVAVFVVDVTGGLDWDDDGDCFCEVGPCAGSIEPSCTSLSDGDCDDGNIDAAPGLPDAPDMTYTDNNCDGIDGDVMNAVFLDPVNGSPANTGLSSASPVDTLDDAYSIAQTQSIDWILIADGNVPLNNDFRQGKNLAGGYDAPGGWARNSLSTPQIDVPSGGRWISNWSTATEWQQIEIVAAPTATTGQSSVALWFENTNGMTMRGCIVTSDNAGGGSAGSTPSQASAGSNGGNGDNGCEDSTFLCSSCSRPDGGSGGSACSGGNTGGVGGRSGKGGDAGSTGNTASGVGPGYGGNGGSGNGDQGNSGFVGSPGASGTNGAAGAPVGTFSGGGVGYVVADGGNGDLGETGGGGGGGGGGAGGGWTFANCDTWGGAGGGGGGGGCGGGGGTGGTGGGASIGMVLLDSAVTIDGGRFFTGNGGTGGNGGDGGQGGLGGLGGFGGDGETSIIAEQSGPGGDGGQGGQGGHGGGGGGGPSVGVVCRGTSSLSIAAAPLFTLGNGGTGGSSLGAAGSTGTQVDTDGC